MITSLLTGLLAYLTLGSASPEGDSSTFKLAHKAHERWDYVLPAERWQRVDSQLELPGGLSFVTEMDGPMKIRVDTNGDGRVDKDVRGKTGGFLTLQGKGEEGEKVRYSIRLRNVAAGKWEWSTGSSRTGVVNGKLVHVFDQNGNGEYDDYGVDALAVGKQRHASLLSKITRIGDELVHLDVSTDGTSVAVRDYDGPTGTLNVQAGFESKGKLVAAVFRDGDLSFEVAGDRRGVEIPAGRYEFVSGRLAKGSAMASIRRGKFRPVEVQEGEITEIEWGEEITGTFNYSQNGEQVTVRADFGIFGIAGEEYYDFEPRGKGPKILVKDAKRGREIVEGRFRES